jgi:plastocyanin
MVLRGRHLRLYLGALAVGAVVAVGMFAGAPAASAQQQTASFAAGDNFWTRTAGVGSSGNNASIFTGGMVFFTNGGNNEHNVTFTAGSQPSSCSQTLPMPGPPTTQDWSGNCTFNSPGTYSFLCQEHANVMTGTVQVVNPPPGGGNPPPPPPGGGGNPPPGGGSGGGGSGGGSGGDPTDPGSPQAGAPSFKVTRKQTGVVLRGSVTTSGAAKIVVTALVSNRYLSTSRPKKVKKVSVGSKTIRRTSAGKANFAVKLNAAARRALKSRDKLSVTLRIVVTPSGGKAITKTVAVKLSAD